MTLLQLPARWLLGVIALFAATTAPVLAATYAVNLYESSTTTGTGSFAFTNPGSPGTYPITMTSLTTNASSSLGANVVWSGAGSNAVVQAVNFSDGKSPPNQITGNFVEGLSGSLTVAGPFPVSTALPAGTCNGSGNSDGCDATITFSYTACTPQPNCNPGTAIKAYQIVVTKTKSTFNGQNCSNGSPCTVATINGTYSVRDTANSAPEPGTLALIALAMVVLGWRYRRSALLAR